MAPDGVTEKALNDAQFSSTFKVVEFSHSKHLKRLATIHSYEPIRELASNFGTLFRSMNWAINMNCRQFAYGKFTAS